MLDKKTLAKAKKDIREKKKAKLKEKKRAEAKITKEKKRVKVKVVKEKKRIDVKAIAWKKIKDKAIENVEISLLKKQPSKCKAALSNDFVTKKKQ